MAWRVHLSNQAIQHLDILPGTPDLLAVWTRNDAINYYNLSDGALFGDTQLTPPETFDRTSAEWNDYLTTLKAPNDACLPVVHWEDLSIYTAPDGTMRLYVEHASGKVAIQQGDKTHTLPLKSPHSLAFDAITGTVAAIELSGQLHLFRDGKTVGSFDIGLKPEIGLPLQVSMARGGVSVATDGHQLVMVDEQGVPQHRQQMHYLIGKMAFARNGRFVLTGDAETGVLRVYRGANLAPIRQRFSIDLMATATQVQLIADLPPANVGISALTIHNGGQLAYALSGVVCVAKIEDLDELPQPAASV